VSNKITLGLSPLVSSCNLLLTHWTEIFVCNPLLYTLKVIHVITVKPPNLIICFILLLNSKSWSIIYMQPFKQISEINITALHYNKWKKNYVYHKLNWLKYSFSPSPTIFKMCDIFATYVFGDDFIWCSNLWWYGNEVLSENPLREYLALNIVSFVIYI
jgi:hypothetical protein